MRKTILDTDILSEYLKGRNSNVADRAVSYLKEHGIFTFTSVTAFEIAYGLELKGATKQLAQALAWLRVNEEVAPVPADYLNAAAIKAKARRSGIILELPDCLIAAIAVRLDRSLVTGNTGDFEAIQRLGINLILENWRNL